MISLAKKAVYLSGPMTGKQDYNRAAFKQAEKELYALGAWFVFNPCEYWRVDGEKLPDWSRTEFLRRDFHMLTGGKHFPQFDMLVSLSGYHQSEGAKAERLVANTCGIPVHTMDEIRAANLRDFWESA